jgi:hypothetical protein
MLARRKMSSSTLDRSAVINTGPIIALVAARQSLEILPQLYSKLISARQSNSHLRQLMFVGIIHWL